MIRSKKGVVVSDKMQNTIVVEVHTYRLHPKYRKRYRISKKFYAHNPNNEKKMGEEVTIFETKPLSKLKRWTIINPEKTATSATE